MDPEKGWLLALDFSTPDSIVILEGPSGLLRRDIEGGSRASLLFVLVAEMMSAAGITPSELSLLGVSRGPGAFTGIRIAVTAAKAMAAVLGIPLVAPDSLMAAAAGVGERVFAVLDARRSEVYYALYDFAGDRPAALIKPGVAAPRQAALLLSHSIEIDGPDTVGVGNGIEAYPEVWPQSMVRARGVHDRAAGLVWLCRSAAGRGETIDPALLLPLYLRRPDVHERCSRSGEGGSC